MNELTDHQREMFAQRLVDLDAEIPGYGTIFRVLESKILKHGGHAVVVVPWPSPYLVDLIEGGRLMTGKIRKVRGERSACHTNTARRYMDGKAHAIGTGFGLSTDGLWREHSWGLTKTGIVVETTEVRTAYFGIELTDARALEFCEGVKP